MDIVYHSLNDTSKGIIDAACCGAFKRRSAEEAKQLIEDMAKCNMKAPSESSGSNSRTKGSGVIELNKMTAMETKLDAIMHKLGNREKRMHYAHEVGAVGRDGIKRRVEGPIDEDPYQVEEANYLNEQRSYHFKPVNSSKLIVETENKVQTKQLGKNCEQQQKEKVQAYTPAVPFPQRLQKAEKEEQISKFLEMFKKIEINIPFADAINQMPNYAKFLKDILSKKKKIAEE